MKRKTPRQELKELDERNGNDGFYGVPNQFAESIRKRIENKAINLMNKFSAGFLLANERLIYIQIYNLLLDGVSEKEIKKRILG
jgi:hypothetical protein